jgi:hypothetical protein
LLGFLVFHPVDYYFVFTLGNANLLG